MAPPLDLMPAASDLASLVEAVPDEALTAPTPCEGYAVGDLLHHIAGFCAGFVAAARKQPLAGAPSVDASDLPADWRTRLPRELHAVAEAWRDEAAWQGMTAAGGVDLPGEVAGVVALDELVLHGWDLARALGRPGGYAGPGLEAVHHAVSQFRAVEIPGLFGPAVPVPDDAPLMDRVLGLSGRDPGWQPPRR